MGLIHTEITLRNPRYPELRPIMTKALVGTGAITLCIPGRIENRGGFGGAMVMGDRVLLGAIAMEDMDLVISPKSRRIEVNPDSPNIPSAVVM